MDQNPQDESLDLVYYPSPVPLNLKSFTPLALIVDRIHFPHVYLPAEGYDFDAVRAEYERIANLPQARPDLNTALLLQSMRLLPHVGQLRTFCNFTGDGHLFGAKDKDSRLKAIVDELDLLMFGKRPPNFEPVHETVSLKGLPGGDEHFEYPGTLYYPATAIAYANDNGLPLVNDQPGLPVPSLGGDVPAKNNEKLLSTILAIECAGLILPNVKPLHPLQIVELREELRPYLRPFRMSLLSLAHDLNGAIQSSSSDDEIKEAAAFLVRTKVVPQLEQLKGDIENPDKPWYSWAFGITKYAPSLATAYASVPLALAAGALTAICDVLVNVADAQRRQQRMARSGMYFLLRLIEKQSR